MQVNLYGFGMSEKLPVGDFRVLPNEAAETFNASEKDPDADEACLVVATLE